MILFDQLIFLGRFTNLMPSTLALSNSLSRMVVTQRWMSKWRQVTHDLEILHSNRSSIISVMVFRTAAHDTTGELPTNIGIQMHHNTWAHRRGYVQTELMGEVQ
jgi:hypothetical protein